MNVHKIPNDFTEVSKADFFRMMKPFDWAKGTPNDIAWWEAHTQFVEDTTIPETVGYLETSSWNPYTKYYVLDRILDEDTRKKIEYENEER